MEQVKNVLNASLLWRWLCALCLWVGRQWHSSGVIQWFLHPRGWTRAASENSVFYKLWALLRRGLCRLYEQLRLERLFAGSVFGNAWFWCLLPVALSPLIPTMAVLGLAAVGCCSLALSLVRDRNRQLAWYPINRYILLYATVYLAGTLFSVSLKASLKPGLLTVFFVLFSLVLCSAVTTQRELDVLLDAVVLAAALVACYGILQFFFHWGYQSDAWVDSSMFSAINFRVTSTFGNPNMLGQYLILTIPLGGARLLSAKDWFSRVYYFCCCGVMCVCMLLTASRGAWLGLLCAGAVFVLLLNPRFILLIPVGLAVLYFTLPETVIARFTSIGDLRDASSSYRLSIWMGSLAMLRDYWLCGIGPGAAAFNMVYPAYGYNGANTQHSHNLFLQLMCDAGVAALAVFLILLFVCLRMLCAAISQERDGRSRLLQIAFTAGICGFLVQAMTDFSFYNYRVLFLFWIYLALAALCAGRSRLPGGRTA